MELADRVAVIFDGNLAQYDAPDVLYKRPNSIEIADFMGAANVFEAEIADQTATAAFGTLVLEDAAKDGPGHVMLRGEAIDLHLQAVTDQPNIIQGKVTAREFFGANITYSVDCGGETIQVSEQSRRMVEIGQPVWLTIPPDRIWIIHDKK